MAAPWQGAARRTHAMWGIGHRQPPEWLVVASPGRLFQQSVGSLRLINKSTTFPEGGRSLSMSAAIVMVVIEDRHREGQAICAKLAATLTISTVEKSMCAILRASSLHELTGIAGAALRFGFACRVLHVEPPHARWPLMVIFPHEHGERRIVPRHKVMLAGKIIVGKRASVIDCTVRNLSSTGAAIELPDAASVPPKFALCFDNAVRHCTVAWRQADRLGVKFRSPA
jgi:PilZ domain